jgi:hypothetical protein
MRERRVDAAATAAAIKFHPEHTHHIIDLGHTWVLQQGRRRLANLERLAGLPLPSPLPPPLSVTTLLLSRIAHSAQMYANMFL